MDQRAAVHRARRAGLLGAARLSHLRRPVARAALHGRLSAGRAAQPRWQPATITAIAPRTPRVKSLRLAAARPFAYRAGQHVDVRLTAPDGYQAAAQLFDRLGARSGERDSSWRSSGCDDGEVSPFFHEVAAVGDEIEMRGPLGGHFVWTAGDGGPLLLIGGGSGVVPLMSMLRHRAAARVGGAGDADLFRARWDEVIFRDELLARDRDEPGLSVIFLLSRDAPRRPQDLGRRLDATALRDGLTAWARRRDHLRLRQQPLRGNRGRPRRRPRPRAGGPSAPSGSAGAEVLRPAPIKARTAARRSEMRVMAGPLCGGPPSTRLPAIRCDAGHMVQAIRRVSDGQPACAAVLGPRTRLRLSACGGVSASTCRGAWFEVARGPAHQSEAGSSARSAKALRRRRRSRRGLRRRRRREGSERRVITVIPAVARVRCGSRRPQHHPIGPIPPVIAVTSPRSVQPAPCGLPGAWLPQGPWWAPGWSIRSKPCAPKKSRCAWSRFAVPRALAHHVEIAERRRRAPASGCRRAPPAATTRAQAPWARAAAARRSAARTSGWSPASPPSACAMSSSIAERMMQPARQILAIVGERQVQPNSFEAAAITPKPWA